MTSIAAGAAGKPPVSGEPAEGAFDHPSSRQGQGPGDFPAGVLPGGLDGGLQDGP